MLLPSLFVMTKLRKLSLLSGLLTMPGAEGKELKTQLNPKTKSSNRFDIFVESLKEDYLSSGIV